MLWDMATKLQLKRVGIPGGKHWHDIHGKHKNMLWDMATKYASRRHLSGGEAPTSQPRRNPRHVEPASALTDVKNNQGKQSLCAIKFSTHTGSKTGPPTHLRDPHRTFGHNRTRRPRRPQRRQGRGCRGSRGRGWSPRPCPAAGARRLPGGKK